MREKVYLFTARVSGIVSSIVFFLILMILVSCTPEGYKIYTIGDTYTLIDGSGSIQLSMADYETATEETCVLKLTYILKPESQFSLNNQDVFVVCSTENYYTEKELNIEYNKTDIFDIPIIKETPYTFHFIIPSSPYFDNLADNKEGYLGWTIQCYIGGTNFSVYTKDFELK